MRERENTRLRKRKHNDGRVAITVKLDFHDWFGSLIDRNKAKVTEKKQIISMIEKLKDRADITQIDIDDFRRKQHQEDLKEYEGMKEHFNRFNKGPVKWNRDSEGNIKSPFDNKR